MKDFSLVVNYNTAESPDVPIEVELRGEPILFGLWNFSVHGQGKLLKPAGMWTETCTYNGNGCEYLEIDLPLSHGYRLQRFFLLDNDDQVLILGDTLLSEKKKGDLLYESTLFHSPNLRTETEEQILTCTFRTKKNKPLFRVLPLNGTLKAEDSILTLRHQSSGQASFTPLFFDLKPERLGKPFFWKRLTVSEDRQQVSEERAAGFRVQLGKEQFLLYKSMTPQANRSVLGHNLVDDLCFARFAPKIGVKPLVTVQMDD